MPLVVVLVALVGGFVGWALPVPSLPAPTGDRAVGTTVVALTDRDRTENYGDDPGGPRELVAQLWYPASRTADRDPGPWVPTGHRFGRAAADWLGLPTFALDHVELVRSHATSDALPARDGTFPLVVYVHGWGGFRTVQSDLAESLASRGYVVAALDHTYASLATQFPDGELRPIDPAVLPEGAPDATYDAASAELVATFAADLDVLLDELEDGAVPALDGRIRLHTVGLVGHSTGGGAAVLACATDERCGALVGFDPWVEPVADTVIGAGLDVPLLSIRSEAWVGNDNDARLRRLHAASRGPTGLVAITGTTHRDVTLLPFLTPLAAQLGLAGPTPGARTHAIIDAWTTGFFDAHLRGDPAADPLLDPPSPRSGATSEPFDEVVIDEVTID